MNRVGVAVTAVAAGLAAGWFLRGARPEGIFAKSPEGPRIATWKGGALTAADLRERMGEFVRLTGAGALGKDQLRAFASDAIRNDLLAQEARRRGLTTSAGVAGRINEVLAKKLIDDGFGEKAATQALSDDELKGYYQAHLGEFVRPEKVRVADIFVAAAETDAATRRDKKRVAEKLRAELAAAPPLDHELFANRARTQTDDEATRSAGGDLGPLSRAEMEERHGREFTSVAWLLVKLGEVSSVIETPAGFHVSKLKARHGALDVRFEQARDTLRSRLWYERRNAAIEKFFADLRAERAASVDEKALDALLDEFGGGARGK